MTLSGKAATTSYSAFGPANASRFLKRSRGSCFSPGFPILTSSHGPAIFRSADISVEFSAAARLGLLLFPAGHTSEHGAQEQRHDHQEAEANH